VDAGDPGKRRSGLFPHGPPSHRVQPLVAFPASFGGISHLSKADFLPNYAGMKKVCLLAAVVGFVAGSGIVAQSAIFTGEISFTNVVWGDGSTSSGYFEYTYDSAGFGLQSIIAANITTTAGSSITWFQLCNSAPGHADNATLGFDYNNASQQKYEAYFEDSATHNDQIFLDWTGVGNSAQLVTTTPGNFASVSVTGGRSYYTVSSMGASTGTIVATPEPATVALMGFGVAGLVALRRRR
jgi:hypothetical protein